MTYVVFDPEKIKCNEGLRSLSKIMLNAHWGKFGQNPDKATMTREPCTLTRTR